MFVPQGFKCIKKFGNLTVRNVCRSCHQYNENTTCCLIAGDGVGPELINSVETVFKATSIPVELKSVKILKNSERSINDAIDVIQKCGVCLKTPFARNEPTLHGAFQNLNVRIRVVLDVYANVAHFSSIPGVRMRHRNVNFFIIREQTEESFTNLEHESVPGMVESLKVVTWKKSWRIAKFAFDYATKLNRKTVVCVHKANIFKLTDGLFLKCCYEVAKLYPKIKFKQMIIDNVMMQLVSCPQKFDVLVTTNLYGNVADNLAAGLTGGAGVVPGAAYSSDCVIFEPVAHHTFTSGAGKNIANPTAILLCAVKMLYHVNLREYGKKLKNSIYEVLKDGTVRTRDIGGQANTTDFTGAVIAYMKKND